MRKLIKFILTVSALVLIIIISREIYLEVNKITYKHRVMDYLVEEKGYKEDEIAHIEGVYGFKMPKFYTIVIFKNEPTVQYTYFAHSGVLQFSYRIIGNEYNETKKQDLKNYDPSGVIN